MPLFQFDKAFGMARDIRSRLKYKQIRREIASKNQKFKQAKNEIQEIKAALRNKRQKLKQIRNELRVAKDDTQIREYRQKEERLHQELSELRRELHAAQERQVKYPSPGRPALQVANERGTGALPDFAIIGAMKGGTTFLYHLLTQHPLVERAAGKEVHYFSRFFDEGVEWYRQCFPAPKWRDGRRTMTGEATPYLAYPSAPERMAQVVPQARLIALLRNPVDRTYSHYQHSVRRTGETRSFEEVIGFMSRDDAPRNRKYLSKSIYADQFLHWLKYFDREQMLVLKSEDFFENPKDSLKIVLAFLDLPDWEPKVWDLYYKRHTGKYKEGMDPVTRRRLEEYFEPHNKKLYDFLGVDFGW